MASGAFVQFDNKTKSVRLEDLKRWISSYEQVTRFCLKTEALVSHYEAEQFSEQIAEMFGKFD